MSIKDRVEEAELLWSQGRKEGAWVPALVATAATARKRYPRPMNDREAFTSFIADITFTIMTGKAGGARPLHFEFYENTWGDGLTLGDVLYKKVRCSLIHEGELTEAGFSKSTEKDGRYTAQLSVPSHGNAQIPDFWALHLLVAVKNAPENSGLFHPHTP